MKIKIRKRRKNVWKTRYSIKTSTAFVLTSGKRWKLKERKSHVEENEYRNRCPKTGEEKKAKSCHSKCSSPHPSDSRTGSWQLTYIPNDKQRHRNANSSFYYCCCFSTATALFCPPLDCHATDRHRPDQPPPPPKTVTGSHFSVAAPPPQLKSVASETYFWFAEHLSPVILQRNATTTTTHFNICSNINSTTADRMSDEEQKEENTGVAGERWKPGARNPIST